MEYNEARDIMATHRHNVLKANGKGKVGSLHPHLKHLKYRTFLRKVEGPSDDIDESYQIEYFQTAIITLYSHKVVINDGTFFSHSTHERLNEYMPKGFKVHGSKPSWYHSTVGFIRTPAGTCAYNLPKSFLYSGLPTEGGSVHAGPSFHKIPEYVDMVLTKAFKGGLDDRQLMEWFVPQDHELGDHSWPVQLLDKPRFIPRLLSYVSAHEDFRPTPEFHKQHLGGHFLADVVSTMLREDARVFTKPNNLAAIVRRSEATLRLGRSLPCINLRTLRKCLREILINFLVAELGFVDKEWNRRDAT